MHWCGVLPCFYAELAKQSPPYVLMLRAGANDLRLMSPQKLAFLMQQHAVSLKADSIVLHQRAAAVETWETREDK